MTRCALGRMCRAGGRGGQNANANANARVNTRANANSSPGKGGEVHARALALASRAGCYTLHLESGVWSLESGTRPHCLTLPHAASCPTSVFVQERTAGK